jgi:hypothetical protein
MTTIKKTHGGSALEAFSLLHGKNPSELVHVRRHSMIQREITSMGQRSADWPRQEGL